MGVLNSRSAATVFLASLLTPTVLAQLCSKKGDTCIFYDRNGDQQNGFCDSDTDPFGCGVTGSMCTTNANCLSTDGDMPCSNGFCGGLGSSCAFNGDCLDTLACASSVGCFDTCPDGSPVNLASPSGIPCSCHEGETYNVNTNKCGCPGNSFMNPAGSAYECTACPVASYSEPASDTCICEGFGGPSLFYTVDGYPFCCAADAIPSTDPRSGGALCTCPVGETYNSASIACDCPANTFASFDAGGDFTSKTCAPCPPNSSSSAGAYICQCDDGFLSIYDDESNLSCETCPSPGSTFNENNKLCRCTSPTQYYSPMSHACYECGNGLVADSESEGCVCTLPGEYYDQSSGSCICIYGSNPTVDCACKGDSTLVTDTSGSLQCRCNTMNQFYVPTQGCFGCPSYATYNGFGGCDCPDPNSEFDGTDACVCRGGRGAGAFYPDPTTPGKCLPCGAGTDPDYFSGCSCLDFSQVLDPVTMSCYTPGVPSTRARAKRSVKRGKLEMQMMLQEWGSAVDWKNIPSKLLCPGGQQACPILPSLSSHECIDIMSEVDSCGGCISLGEGVDCLTIPGVNAATCEAGVCQACKSFISICWSITYHPSAGSCLPGWSAVEIAGQSVCEIN